LPKKVEPSALIGSEEKRRGFDMKKIVLLVALMVAAGGAYAGTLSTQTATDPEVQVAETVEAPQAEADEALSSELATEIEAALCEPASQPGGAGTK
jgi:hypothetical protein